MRCARRTIKSLRAAATEIGNEQARTQAQVLAMPDVHAHNTFENPRAVQPRNEQVTVTANGVYYRFAPASVTSLQIALE